MSVVRVVLLCKGRGGDASSYRPNRDESQWWNRRDALVRCTAAFLYGPPSTQLRELVFIHDEDFARMEMRLDSSIVPTEQAILSLWKEAAKNPGAVMAEGVTCRMVPYPSSAASLPSSMDSKRQVLEHLQKQCSIDFLRKHGLNSSASVILRKTNKQTLMTIWNQWNTENASDASSNREEQLSSIFQELLKPMSDSIKNVVAGVLHESSTSELPCFDHYEHAQGIQVCLFLGAVRDMHPWENRVLNLCCSKAHVPLLRVRLGPVPEFTSKILTVVAHHHARGTLGPSLLRLEPQLRQDSKSNDLTLESSITQSQRLHVFCFVPIRSEEVSSDLKQRSRALWALVRVTVCTLWRSRLASSSDRAVTPLHNVLTILFQDGTAMTLYQDDLVTSLAEQHQAAPSEYQILQALCRKRDLTAAVSGTWTKEQVDRLIEDSIDTNQPALSTYALDICVGDSTSALLPTLYSLKEADTNQGSQLLVLLRIRNEDARDYGGADRLFIKALKRRDIPVLRESIVSAAVQDEEAVSVTMLQHFIYQGRLFPALERLANKKSKDKKRRQKKEETVKEGKKKR